MPADLGVGPRSELRILRLCTAAVGVCTLLATVVTSLVIAQPNRLTTPAWFWPLGIAAMLVVVLTAGIAPWAGPRTLRWLNALIVVEYGALLAALAVAGGLGRFEPGEVPWLLTVTAAPVNAALAAWGRRAGWLVLLLATAMVQVVRLAVGHDTRQALASDVQVFFASLTLMLLFGALLHASREFDRSTAAAYLRASRASAEEARESVRQRLQVLVHDELLSTLVLAAQDVPAFRTAIATQAARGRRLLHELHEPDAAEQVPVDSLVGDLRAVVAEEAPRARFALTDSRTTAGDGAQVGLDVAAALTGATRQALVNSRLHAGPSATVSVTARIADDSVRVEVADDGVGFDPERVPATRMGITSSIVGRLQGVPGGSAQVESQPGAGTRVTLRWGRETPSGDAVEVAEAATYPTGVLPADDDRIRRGILVLISVFWMAQAGLAVIAGRSADDVWVAVLTTAGIGLGFLAIGWSSLAQPSVARSWLVVSIVVATSALSLVPIDRDPTRYGDTWYVAAGGFVLAALAVRGRPGVAGVGGLIAVGLALVGGRLWPDDVEDLVASSTRHSAVLLVAVLLVLAITRTQARTAALRAAELAAIRAQAFREAGARELRERTRALEDLIGRLLERLETGDELTRAERRECAALDGRLRDQYRGGRIVRPPMIESAMAARRRGVDVVLLDDAAEETTQALSEADLDLIAGWLAEQLDRVMDGRFTGRILPNGRDSLASAVVGDEVRELRRDQVGDLLAR